MEFRVLGPLEVLEDGRAVDLGAPKQRALLAILLLHANEVVSTERLVDDLWEDEPPDTARKALQVYVSQLRKLLGRERLHTRDRGYMLTVADGELDLDRFRGLVAAGDPVGALGLWRGEPLQGFADRGFAAPDIARLEELKLTAIEERNEQQLAAGKHVELVGELELLVRAHPLRERLRGQQMLALYRSGRQAEALDAYQDARRTLTDELGIEPGRELRDLQQQILNQDSRLDLPIATSAAADAGVQKQPRRRLPRALLVVGLLLLGAAAVAVVLSVTRGSSKAPVVVKPNSVALIDPRTNSVVDDIQVGNSPSSVAVGEGAVWVLNGDDRTVSRVDLATRSVRTIAIGGNPSDLTVGNGSLWVVNAFARTVLRVDPDTGIVERTIRLQGGKTGVDTRASIASARGAIWVSIWRIGATESSRSFIWRIDPSTSRVMTTYPGLGGDVATSFRTVWIARAALTSIDSRTGEASTASVFDPPDDYRQIATSAGGIWVVSVLGGTLSKFGAFDHALQRTITVGGSPEGVATGAGSVWVANAGDATVVRIDPLTVRLTKTISLDRSPGGVAVSPEGIWVTVA